MKKKKYIKEKEIKNQSQAIDSEEMIILLDLMKTHICKINTKEESDENNENEESGESEESHGTGFFCNIPIGWNINLKVLMTNNHVLNINAIQPGQIINFSINNDEKEFNILMDNRKTYTNESFDVTIIEIKEDDTIDEKSFFDLDKQIFQEKCINIY